jgi:zinc transport system substrate-binding protein
MNPTATRIAAAVAMTIVAVTTAPGTARAADRTEVAAAFYPLAFVAQAVGGGHVDVENLTPPGVEPHDLELTPDQVDALQDASLVVAMGKGFQPAVEQVAEHRDRGTLEVLRHLKISPALRDDPHVWLDPVRMGEIVDEVRAALVQVDPKHAGDYRANAARLHTQLDALDAAYRSGLATCERNLVVTAHEAFGHLAARYGLRQEGVSGLAPDAEPSARRLGELADLARTKGVTTIFTEELVSPKVAQTLAREAGGLRTAVLNPLEGLTDREQVRGDDYFGVMRSNLRKLQRALGCSAA